MGGADADFVGASSVMMSIGVCSVSGRGRRGRQPVLKYGGPRLPGRRDAVAGVVYVSSVATQCGGYVWSGMWSNRGRGCVFRVVGRSRGVEVAVEVVEPVAPEFRVRRFEVSNEVCNLAPNGVPRDICIDGSRELQPLV